LERGESKLFKILCNGDGSSISGAET